MYPNPTKRTRTDDYYYMEQRHVPIQYHQPESLHTYSCQQPHIDLEYLDKLRKELHEKEISLQNYEKSLIEKDKKCQDSIDYITSWEKHNMRLLDVLHPSHKYKYCKFMERCNKQNCKFAHSKEELSIPYKLYWCVFGKECKNHKYNRCAYSHSCREWLEYYSYDDFKVVLKDAKTNTDGTIKDNTASILNN